jgi:tRNA A-37 threonylcarbamoyl transferase component Bud32
MVPAGARVGPYEIESALGSTESAAVYRARHSVSGTPVALKQALQRGFVQSWAVEARLLASLDHPSVVALVDHFEEPEGIYNLAMELVEGTDLARLLWDRGNPGMPVDEVLPWVRDACGALQYLHDQQVVHADVKPRNLIRDRARVVLVDFGLAGRQLTAGATSFGGTPMFMAPEVFAGELPSPRSDVFGVAATAWTLIAGTPPVYGEDRSLVDTAGVSAEIEAALRAGLEFHAEDRIESAAAFAAALGAPAARQGASLTASAEWLGGWRVLCETLVRAAAGTFEAAAASIALVDPDDGRLHYVASWGAGAHETVQLVLPPGVGIAGAVVESGHAQVVGRCRTDSRFASAIASQTEYVPYTMLVVPMHRGGETIGVLSLLDRRDGLPYTAEDARSAQLMADVAAAAFAG